MSPDKERHELPKRKAPGKDGLESGEEGGLLVVQHGEPRNRVQQTYGGGHTRGYAVGLRWAQFASD